MLRVIGRLIALGIFGFTATIIGVATFAALWPIPTPKKMTQTDIIVVLGAGMDPDGTLHRSTTLRVDRGVELWKADLAPRLHFTGGQGRPGGPSAGERMAERAISQGVPIEVISYEGRSLSTLQNALFSQPMLEDAKTIRLVTEGFHLPRSYLSFWWAGDHDIYLSFSERFRNSTLGAQSPDVVMVFREALAVWFNLARVGIYETAAVFGVEEARRIGWLN